ncbi:MAG: hypothetical protein PHG04_00840 [Candidatus Nanoarchaeia archaeon]|nr:hypothetical protein [Candidatus Nanoarchaeia archaeon]MDD5053910.1 hypothetical protein [Candidatus Nanoarchaeia archaeon]
MLMDNADSGLLGMALELYLALSNELSKTDSNKCKIKTQILKYDLEKVCNVLGSHFSPRHIYKKLGDYGIQKAYSMMIEGAETRCGGLWLARKFEELINIKPSEDVVQQAHEKLLLKENIICSQELGDWMQMPNKKTMNNVYKSFIDKGDYHAINWLIRITQIVPDEELVQQGIEKLILQGNIWNAEKIVEFTEIEPKFTEERALDAYLKLEKSGELALHNEFFIEKLEKLTGIKIPDYLVQEIFYKLFLNGEYFTAKKIEKYTRVKPCKRTKKRAKKTLKEMINNISRYDSKYY